MRNSHLFGVEGWTKSRESFASHPQQQFDISYSIHTKERSQMRHQRTRHSLANLIEAVSSAIEMMKF
eukprot:scaffold700_cov113-Skeletonema_dohrnii-CCMP3373.AAC.1